MDKSAVFPITQQAAACRQPLVDGSPVLRCAVCRILLNLGIEAAASAAAGGQAALCAHETEDPLTGPL